MLEKFQNIYLHFFQKIGAKTVWHFDFTARDSRVFVFLVGTNSYIKLGFGLGGVGLNFFWGGWHQVLGGCCL